MKHEILLGLTTTPASDWRGKVEEMKKFGIKRIALFPTFLKIEDRKELYDLLGQIDELEIPHVHLRNDMTMDEVQYFIDRFNTVVFNIHPDNNKYSFPDELLKYANRIYIENLIMIPTENELKKYAGICIDFSHWENNVLMNNADYNQPTFSYNDVFLDRLSKFSVGCCHVSAMKEIKYTSPDFPGGWQYDNHIFNELIEFDYIKKYRQYLPKYISLELENSFEQQLEVKKYLKNTLNL